MPNSAIINSVLVNHTKQGLTRVDVPIGIAYKEYIPQAREVILQAVESIDGVVAAPHPDVVVTGLADSGVNLQVRVWIQDMAKEQPVFFAVLEQSKLGLDAAGIEISCHHLQLFIEKVEDRVWQSAARHLSGFGEGASGSGEDPTAH